MREEPHKCRSCGEHLENKSGAYCLRCTAKYTRRCGRCRGSSGLKLRPPRGSPPGWVCRECMGSGWIFNPPQNSGNKPEEFS